MASTRRTILMSCLALVAIAVAAGIYVLRVALSEDYRFEQGGLAYWIVVTSDTVRDFPTFEAEREPVRFTYRARDGTAPGEITMAYLSTEPAEALERQFVGHCTRMGFPPVPKEGLFLLSDLGCDAPDYRVEIDVQPRGDTVAVTVVFLES